MGQTDELNHPKPPRCLEWLVGLAIPSASREYVLGDLHERYTSLLRYLMDAASAAPAAILGSLRRSTPLPFVLLEFLLICASMVLAGFWAKASLMGPVPLSLKKSAAAALYLTVVLAGRDAYRRNPLSRIVDKIDAIPPCRAGRFQLRYAPGYYLYKFWPGGFRRVRIVGEIYLTLYFALGFYWAAHAALPALNVFPGIMTTTLAPVVATALLAPLRLWLGSRQQRPGLHA